MTKHNYQLLADSESNTDSVGEEIELYDVEKKKYNGKSNVLVSPGTLPCNSIRGILCAFGSCCFFATGSVFTKLCKGYLDAFQIVMIRSFIQLLFCIPLITFYRLQVWQDFCFATRILLILRGTLGGCGLILIFYSFQNLPLGDASAIVFSASVYTVFLARIFLKEKFVYLDIMVLIATVLGVIFISQPSIIFSKRTENETLFESNNVTRPNVAKSLQHDRNPIWGLIAAIIASLMIACSHIVLRKLPSVHYTIPLFYLSVAGVTVTSLTLVIQNNFLIPKNPKYWGFVIFVGLCGFVGQALMTKAYQMEKAGPVAIVRQCDIVFAYIFQVAVFGDALQSISFLGAILVIGGTLVLAIKKLVLTNQSSRIKMNSCICKEV